MAEPAVLPLAPIADLTTPEGRAHYARSLDCVHCGMCLPVCPTYQVTGNEASSPRGRIYLMRAAADGRLAPSADYERELAFCLVCRACETVCPSGVEFEALVENARADLAKSRPVRGRAGVARRFLLRRVLPSRFWLGLAANALALYSKSPLRGVLVRLGVMRALFPGLLAREHLMPRVPPRKQRRGLPALTPAQGAKRGRVAILEGCVASQLLPEVNRSTARVLARNGWEVAAYRSPACCGALHAHCGDIEGSRDLARRNIEEFERTGAEWFVQNSAGCGAHARSYPRLLEQHPGWKQRAEAVAARTRDVTEFLAEQGLAPRKTPYDRAVAYHEACHLVHGQRVSAQPKRLLEPTPGLRLVPLAGATECCGAAGPYALTRPEDSMRFLDRKMECIRESGATVVATGNPGCILQLRVGARRAGMELEVVHPIQILDEPE